MNEYKPNREELIEWLEQYKNMLPPHMKVCLSHSITISEQDTHILRNVYSWGKVLFPINKN